MNQPFGCSVAVPRTFPLLLLTFFPLLVLRVVRIVLEIDFFVLERLAKTDQIGVMIAYRGLPVYSRELERM